MNKLGLGSCRWRVNSPKNKLSDGSGRATVGNNGPSNRSQIVKLPTMAAGTYLVYLRIVIVMFLFLGTGFGPLY